MLFPLKQLWDWFESDDNLEKDRLCDLRVLIYFNMHPVGIDDDTEHASYLFVVPFCVFLRGLYVEYT